MSFWAERKNLFERHTLKKGFLLRFAEPAPKKGGVETTCSAFFESTFRLLGPSTGVIETL